MQRIPRRLCVALLSGLLLTASCSTGNDSGAVRIQTTQRPPPAGGSAEQSHPADQPAARVTTSLGLSQGNGPPALQGQERDSSSQPASGGPAEIANRGSAERKEVALTFDAGMGPGYTAVILDTLARRGVKATFGLTGAWCEANPELARRIAAEGHAVINHTFSHTSWTGRSPGTKPLTAEQRRGEIRRAETAIEACTGVTGRPFFRSPYGDQDASVQRDLAALGYRYNVLWTYDSAAWRGRTAEEIVSTGIAAASPGAIYVLHVAEQQDALALERLIDGIATAGYGFVTVPRILSRY